MNDADLVKILRQIAETHEDHLNDEEGDKFLSDTHLFSEVICDVLLTGDIRKAKRDGWIS